MAKRRRPGMGVEFLPQFMPGEQPGGQAAMWESMFGAFKPVVEPAERAPAAPARPGTPAWTRPSVDAAKYYDLKALFEHVKALRTAPGWKPPAVLEEIARPTRDPVQAATLVGRHFGLSDTEIARYGQQAWQYVVEPFIRQLERSLNIAKPAALPGSFKFDFAPDGSYVLGYVE